MSTRMDVEREVQCTSTHVSRRLLQLPNDFPLPLLASASSPHLLTADACFQYTAQLTVLFSSPITLRNDLVKWIFAFVLYLRIALSVPSFESFPLSPVPKV